MQSSDTAMEEGAGIGAFISQLPAIMWQRKLFILVPLLLGTILAIAAAFLMPTRYESSAVMIVQSPALSDEVIGVGTGEQIDRRIEAIRQQIITRPALLAMIEANGLYPEERRSQPLSTIIEDMREAITLEPDVVELGNAQPNEDAISVRLAYTYKDPVKTQAVAQGLMERVVEVNATTNSNQAEQAVRFLTDQQADLRAQIDAIETQLTALNARYGGVLASGNAPMVVGNTAPYDVQIAELERDNVALRGQRSALDSADTRDPQVVAAEARLATLRATYSDSHPDVVLARRQLSQARELARGNVEKIPTQTIDNQIASNERQLRQLRELRAAENARTASSLSQRAQVPAVQQQAAQIQQQLEGYYDQFEEVSQRLLEAKAGERANDEQMGERLLVVDPPVIPDQPASPNRPLIIALGILGGLALGCLLALAVEIFMRPIRDPKTVRQITGARPLAVIPVLQPALAANRRRHRLVGWLPFVGNRS